MSGEGAIMLGPRRYRRLVLTSDVSDTSIRCMRTTIDIEDPVMKDLRKMQKREGTTLGALVSRLLAQAIAARRRDAPRHRLAWTSRQMRPLLDVADKEAVYAAMEGGAELERP
jgi:hypothetical protein